MDNLERLTITLERLERRLDRLENNEYSNLCKSIHQLEFIIDNLNEDNFKVAFLIVQHYLTKAEIRKIVQENTIGELINSKWIIVEFRDELLRRRNELALDDTTDEEIREVKQRINKVLLAIEIELLNNF